jgi:hypothetical protein
MLVTANNNINNNEYKKRLRSYKLEVKNEVKNEGKIEMLYENILVHNAEPDCLICLESSQQTNKLIKMKDFVLVDSSNCKCNGNFHNKCLLDWINVSKSCPICRSIITININLLKQMNLKYKYNNAITQCEENARKFINMCYGVLMIMFKYMMLVYLVNIFMSIMKELFELSLKKAQ